MEENRNFENYLLDQISLYNMSDVYVKKTMAYIKMNNVEVIPSSKMPNRSNGENYPDYLFGKGDSSLLKKFKIGIVGTRKPDNYGIKIVSDIIRQYKNRDIVTVSGFAQGIDSLVHTASAENGIGTIAVLPCGFSINYPVSNKTVKEMIVKSGLLLSEYSPYIKPFVQNFIRRNYLIALLSDIIIITQGAEKSGTLSTLSWAMKLKKQIFAIPGEINNKLSYAPNYAIFRGAVPIYTKDILPGIKKCREIKMILTESEERMIGLIKETEDMTEIINSNVFTKEEVMSIITNLELKGVIRKGFNNKITILED